MLFVYNKAQIVCFRSLYLPEPLAVSQEGSKYVNLPSELRETPIGETGSQTDTSNCQEKTSSSPAVPPAASKPDVNPSDDQNFQEQQMQLKSDPNVASALISSSPPPGNTSTDMKSNRNETGQSEAEKGSADSGTRDNEGQDVSVNGRIEVSGCDLSNPVKLSLEELGESSQESKFSLMP